jgi:DNA-binding PadR family transcriptional regulator
MFAHAGPRPWPFFFAAGSCGKRPFPGPPWLFDLFGGQRERAERGEVRYLILDALRGKARHGYEIIQAIEEKAGGGYRPSPGTIYPTLQLLEELGQVRAREEGGKRLYELTAEGERELAAHAADVDEAYERLRGDTEWLDADEIHSLMQRVHRLMRAVGRAFRRGRLRKSELRRISQTVEEAISKIEEVVKGA